MEPCNPAAQAREASPLKKVVSVSLGSSTRDHHVTADILGETFTIERRGTDGDLQKAVRLVGELDGQVDAIGLGGIDLYVVTRSRRYTIRDALRIAGAAKKTPVVDGSGLKNTLERRVVQTLQQDGTLPLAGRTVLLVSAVDRFGMAEAMEAAGARLIIGDLIFGLGIPIPLHTLKSVDVLGSILLPVLCRLPFKLLYPTGKEQEHVSGEGKYSKYYTAAEVIAGDYHFIRKHLPQRLDGKVILTNTVTAADVDLLRGRGLARLITTTPELGGRSFGTNVMEAVLVAVAGKGPGELTPADYEGLLDRIGFRPRVEVLN